MSALLLQNTLNGLAIGGVYAMFALGYTLVFSVLRIINFAHASVFTLGAYFTYLFTGGSFADGLLTNQALPAQVALPFILAMLAGAGLAGLSSIAIERVAFKPLRSRGADSLLTLVSSLGVAIALVNIIQYLVGTENYSFSGAFATFPPSVNFGTELQPIRVRTIQIIILCVSMVIVIGLTYFITATKTGKALQAIAEDATTASLLGINTDRLTMLTFFLSGFLGGIAGTLVGVSVSINGPYFGINFGLKGLAVIVLGGLGDIPGAVVGGIVIGLAEAFVPAQAIAYKDAIAFALLFVVLLIRPQGLLGRAIVQKV